MGDYLGPLALGTSATSTYQLQKWSVKGSEASLEVLVRGTNADTLASAYEALAAQLQVGNVYVHYFPGVTSPVVYRILSASSIETDENEGSLAFWTKCTFTLNLSGSPIGAMQTLYDAEHVYTPASVSLAAMLGTNPVSADVTIDDGSGNGMHSVWAALAPTALSDAKWLVMASALTWTTMSNGTGATYWGNSNRYTVSSSYQTAPLDTSQYPAGKYRLLARVCQEAGTGYIKDSQNDVAVAITRTTPHILVIGDLDLPVSDTAPGVASNLTISVKSDGTNDCLVNALLLIPLDYGFFSWHHDTATTEIDQLDVGPSGIFMDGVTDMSYFTGSVLAPRVLAAHTGTLVVTAQPTGNTWPTDWAKTDAEVTADTNRFKFATATGNKWAWYAATNAATPLIVPGAWYALSITRQVTAWAAGFASIYIVWKDVDGNDVRYDLVSAVGATDASPVALEFYAKAPAQASRAQVFIGAGSAANLTAYFSAVAFRRCPLRLILVAEDQAGTLASNLHPVHLTLKYTPRYEVAR
jgi:hypothetical protein